MCALICIIKVSRRNDQPREKKYDQNLAGNYSEKSRKLTFPGHPVGALHSHLILFILCKRYYYIPTSKMQKLKLQKLSNVSKSIYLINGRTIQTEN